MLRAFIPLLVLVLVSGVVAQGTYQTAVPIVIGLNSGSTVGNPQIFVGACTGSSSPSYWYTYVPSVTGTVLASLCTGGGTASYDTMLAAYSGNQTAVGAQVACNDDTCGLQSEITFSVTGGSSYLIRVGGFSLSAGTFTLAFSGPAPLPPFDLTMNVPSGPGSLGISIAGGTAGNLYFNALSFDLANSTAPNQGWWFGLWINILDLITEHISSAPPFVGILDANGAASYLLPAGTIPANLYGITLYGVTTTFNYTTGYLTRSSGVKSVTFN